MNKPVAGRRFVVPAVLAGITLLGTLGWSAVASAEEVHSHATNASATSPVAATKSAQPATAARAEPTATLPRASSAVATSRASRTVAPTRTTDMSSRGVTRTSTAAAGRSLPVHLPAHTVTPRYGIDGTMSIHR